jgi:tetratricopeptide (TPR) repeat protein
LSDAPDREHIISAALIDQADLSLLGGHRDEAIVLAEALIARATHHSDLSEPLLLARALGVIGAAHVGDGRYDQALPILDTILARFHDVTDAALRGQVALALINKALALDALGRDDESHAVHRHMVTHFGDEALIALDQPAEHLAVAARAQVREQLASALYLKSRILTDLGRRDDALLALSQLLARFQDERDPNTQMILADAHEARQQLLEK